MSADSTYLVKFPDKISGPFTLQQLQKLAARGRLTPETLVSIDADVWQAASLLKLDFTKQESESLRSTPRAYCPNCQAALLPTATICETCGYDFATVADSSTAFSDFANDLGEASADKSEGGRFFYWLNIACLVAGFLGACAPVVWLVVVSSTDNEPVLSADTLDTKKLAALLLFPIFGFVVSYFVLALLVFSFAPTAVWNHRLGQKWLRIFGTQSIFFARLLCWIHLALAVAIIVGVAYLFYGSPTA